MHFPQYLSLKPQWFFCVWQLHDAICDPHLHETPGSESQGASEPGAEAGPDWFPAKNQGSAAVATEDLCAIQTPAVQEKKLKIAVIFMFQEDLGLLNRTANLRAEIGFCIYWK